MVWGPLVLEFLNSVQWPCTVIILAGHRVPDGTGIVVTSVAARLGSLVGMMVSQQVLWYHHPDHPSSSSWHWRLLAGLATWSALVAASVLYLYVQDTPDQPDAPTHPVHAHIMKLWFPHEYYSSNSYYSHGRRKSLSSSSWTMGQRWRWSWWVATGHAGPAVWKLLTSGPTFWILALAHTGSLVVRTAERILPAYAAATHTMTTTTTHTAAYAYDEAASTVETVDEHDLYRELDAPPLLAAYSSAGTVLGLLFVGRLFANQADHPRARKWLVGRLYAVAVAACYVLAGLAVPVVVQSLPSQVVALGQVLAVTVASAAVAVPCFHIPSLVAAQQQQQQQHDRGLFLAYTDGVAYGLASLVWKFLSGRLARSDGTSTNSSSSTATTATTTASDTSGWAYGWAAVALLLLVAGVTMTEFMEHYFCSAAAVRNRRQRQYRGGTYETILLA